MNEDLKNKLCEKLICDLDPNERKAVKDTLCILLAKKCSNCYKYIYFYSSDLIGEGFDDFQIEYEIYYSNNEFQMGSCSIETEKVLEAFGFKSYNDLKKYFAEKYSDKDNAWREIRKEIEDKGLDPSVDESRGNEDFMTNF